MTMQFKSKQRGLSFIGLVFVASILAMAGVVFAQIIPTFIEYQSILKAANKSARDGNSVPEVRNIFDRQAAVDDFKSVTGKDIDVTKEGDKIVVSFAYERDIPLVGPAFLVMRYNGRSK